MLIAAGESLIDLIQITSTKRQDDEFRAVPGGSPYNCAIAMARLGGDVGFLCPFSSDGWGQQLVAKLEENQVSPLIKTAVDAPTSLAVVSLDEHHEPNYSFYRTNTADRQLSLQDLSHHLPDYISGFHFGSLGLIDKNDAEIWVSLALQLKERQVLVTLDPNVRPTLIKRYDQYLRNLNTAMELCDVLKFSDADLRVLFPNKDPLSELFRIQTQYQIPLVIMTKGAQGSIARTLSGQLAHVPSMVLRQVGDMVGSGDTFQGSVLFWITERFERPIDHLEQLSQEHLEEMLRFANTSAALNCEAIGCNPPTRAAVDQLMKSRWWDRP